MLGQERAKRRESEEAREEGSPTPLFSPQANAACLTLTQWKRVSSAWHHFLAPEGTQDVRRKTLFCQLAEHNFDMEPGQNASVICALHGLLMPLATLPFPA